MMYTMPKNLLSICVNFALATQQSLVISVSVVLRIEFSLYAHNKRVTSKNKEKAQTFLPALMFWGDSGKNLIFYSPVKRHDNIL